MCVNRIIQLHVACCSMYSSNIYDLEKGGDSFDTAFPFMEFRDMGIKQAKGTALLV